MKVAAVQMSSQDRVDENLQTAGRLTLAAAGEGARLVCLPEGFAYLGPESGRRAIAEPRGGRGPIQDALSGWALRSGAYVLAGGMPITSGDPQRPFNSSLLFAPDGRLVSSYDKLHLFDVGLDDGTVLSESEATSAGSEVVVVEVPDATPRPATPPDRAAPAAVLGLSICYDVRFPELYQAQRERGVELCIVTAAFTQTTGEAHWHVLVRARAIETQCFVVAAAQFGAHGPVRRTYGHSMIVDPWGRVLSELATGEGFVCAEVDLDLVRSVRRQMPVWQHKRLERLS